jgi:hypothetical protein
MQLEIEADRKKSLNGDQEVSPSEARKVRRLRRDFERKQSQIRQEQAEFTKKVQQKAQKQFEQDVEQDTRFNWKKSRLPLWNKGSENKKLTLSLPTPKERPDNTMNWLIGGAVVAVLIGGVWIYSRK